MEEKSKISENSKKTLNQRLNFLFFAFIDITKILIAHPKQIKHIFKWIKSLFYLDRPLNHDLPWLTYDAIDWLESHLDKKMTVFEWGSGASTFYFARKVKKIFSLEHDKTWYEEVQKKLEEESLKNKVEYYYEPPEKLTGKKEKLFLSPRPECRGYSFKKYCQIIDKFPDHSFDLILIDGKARNDCLRLAKRKVKKTGYLILDNSDDLECKNEIKKMGKRRRSDFLGISPFNTFLTQTTIWQNYQKH